MDLSPGGKDGCDGPLCPRDPPSSRSHLAVRASPWKMNLMNPADGIFREGSMCFSCRRTISSKWSEDLPEGWR